jgi:hypothetical protein
VDSNVSCNGLSDGQASAGAIGGTAPYSYSWNNGTTGKSTSGLSQGSYTVTLTDANGCTATQSVSIAEPAPLQGTASIDSNVVCNGQKGGQASASVIGGTAPYSYSWSNGDLGPVANSLGAGPVSVVVTDANNCKDTQSVTITEPAPLQAAANLINNVSCNGSKDGKVSVSASGGTTPYNYTWSDSQSGPKADSLSAGNYSVIVTDANGCNDSDSITISEPTPLQAIASVNQSVSCHGLNDGVASANASGGTPSYSYTWSNGETGYQAQSLSAGSIKLIATDANACSDTDSVIISEPAPLSSSVTTTPDTNGQKVGSASVAANGGTSPYTYTWSNDSTGQSLLGLAAGSYVVTIEDSNGCSLKDTAKVDSVTTNERPSSKDSQELIIKLYPNPTSGKLTIYGPFSQQEPGQLRVLDATGRIIRRQELTRGRSTLELDVAAGVYQLDFRQQGRRRLQKVIVR